MITPTPSAPRPAHVDAGLQIIVGLFEVIVGGIGGVGVEIREDVVHVHEAHAGIVERHVVQTHRLHVQSAVKTAGALPCENGAHAGCQRHPVHRFELPRHPSEIDFQKVLYRKFCKKEKSWYI